jgi:hypothetical protein
VRGARYHVPGGHRWPRPRTACLLAAPTGSQGLAVRHQGIDNLHSARCCCSLGWSGDIRSFWRPVTREDRTLLPRPPGDRLRSCPPTSAWRLPSPPLLHCAGHPTPSTATSIAACEGIEDPNAAVVAGALWRVAVWSEVKGEERAEPGPEDMNGTQRPGAVLSHRPLTGSSVVDTRTAATRHMPMIVSIRTNPIAYQWSTSCACHEHLRRDHAAPHA